MADSLPYAWGCSCCGGSYDTLPLKWVAAAPQAFGDLPEAEQQKSDLTDDFCVIGARDHYVLGHIVIPVLEHDEKFVWGAWVHMPEKDAYAVRNGVEGVFSGKLNTSLPLYPETDGLDVKVHVSSAEEFPRIEVMNKHPLAMEQRNGIALGVVIQIASMMTRGF